MPNPISGPDRGSGHDPTRSSAVLCCIFAASYQGNKVFRDLSVSALANVWCDSYR